jgi:predicted XRE-type DNA-binding protein
MRAVRSSPSLTREHAVAIWRLRWQGLCQHKIAAALDLNQGRVSEVLSSKRFPEAEALARKTG